MKPTSVAFQGVPGAYSELAAYQYFGRKVRTVPCDKFEEVFDAVRVGRVAYGIIPIENSLAGSIHENFDLLRRKRVWIAGETKLRVSHALLGLPQATLKGIRKVYSHPQALWQCHHSLKKLRQLEPIPYFDTAGSARCVAETKDPAFAAVASAEAGKRYGLKVLRAGIEDNKHNFTRFLVLSAKPVPPQRRECKTSILFEVKSRPGSLYLALGVFATSGLQLTKIESRPIPGKPWEYLFYLDFEGDIEAPKPKQALKELKTFANRITILGCYSPK